MRLFFCVGYDVVCFEQNDDTGGLWNYSEKYGNRTWAYVECRTANESEKVSLYFFLSFFLLATTLLLLFYYCFTTLLLLFCYYSFTTILLLFYFWTSKSEKINFLCRMFLLLCVCDFKTTTTNTKPQSTSRRLSTLRSRRYVPTSQVMWYNLKRT